MDKWIKDGQGNEKKPDENKLPLISEPVGSKYKSESLQVQKKVQDYFDCVK